MQRGIALSCRVAANWLSEGIRYFLLGKEGFQERTEGHSS
jgi:hypothetical protein